MKGLDQKQIVGQDVFMDGNPNIKITDYNPETGQIEIELDDETFNFIVKKMSNHLSVSSRSCDCNDCKCDQAEDNLDCNCKNK